MLPGPLSLAEFLELSGGSRRPRPPSGERHQIRGPIVPPDSFVDQDRLFDTLDGEMDRLGLSEVVTLNVVDRIAAVQAGDATEIDGRNVRGLVDVALGAPDPRRVVRHEAIHAMADMGLFTRRAWDVLTRAAASDWRRRYDIDARYEGAPEAVKIEEAIAEAFADYDAGALDVRGPLARALAKIRRFLQALGSALRGQGFQSADDVFGRIESGAVGGRARAMPGSLWPRGP